jgi:hypothetical protein
MHLLDLPLELLLRILLRLCLHNRCLGALDLAAVSCTCTALGAARGEQPSLANEAARIVLRSPACVELLAAAGAPASEDDDDEADRDADAAKGGGGQLGAARWTRALHHFDAGLWRSLKPIERAPQDLGCRAVSPSPALVGGAQQLLTAGEIGLPLWSGGTADLERCSVTVLLSTTPHAITALAAVPSCGLVAAATDDDDGTLRILDLAAAGRLLHTVRVGSARISSIAACGELVLCAGESTHVSCVAARSGQLLPPLIDSAPGLALVATCGSTVAVACAGSIQLFEQRAPHERLRPTCTLRAEERTEETSALALVSERVLASADFFGGVSVWCRDGREEEEGCARQKELPLHTLRARPTALGQQPWRARLNFDALDPSTDAECLGLSLAPCRERFLLSGHVWELSIKVWNVWDGTLVARIATSDGVGCLGCVPTIILCSSGTGSVGVWRPPSWQLSSVRSDAFD